MSVPVPRVPNKPLRHAGEKRYLLQINFLITVLSNSSETYISNSVSTAFKYDVRFDVLYGFFFRYAYNFLVLECHLHPFAGGLGVHLFSTMLTPSFCYK